MKEEEEYVTEMVLFIYYLYLLIIVTIVQLVQLLRGYSLLYSPTKAGKLLEDIIVPE